MLPGEVSRSRVHFLYSHPRKGNRDSANFAMRMSENSEWGPTVDSSERSGRG
jgi:hypothetical protein